MKRSFTLLCAFLLFTLAGCADRDNPGCLPEELPTDKVVESDFTTLRCRVVSVSESGTLLAGADAGNPDIYVLGADELTSDVQLAAGELVEVICGTVREVYPARFGEVQDITVLPDEFDDRCTLYLKVLEDLWNTDEGLNGDITMVSTDLSATSLTPAERNAVAWTFAHAHDAEPLELSYDALCAQGYIGGLAGENPFPAWENGILFTITETDKPVTFSLPNIAEYEDGVSMAQYNVKNTVSFDAEKWRTALGAYGFSECVAVQNSSGVWGDYTVTGGEYIS